MSSNKLNFPSVMKTINLVQALEVKLLTSIIDINSLSTIYIKIPYGLPPVVFELIGFATKTWDFSFPNMKCYS